MPYAFCPAFMKMKELLLQPRLQLLADMVPAGSRLADVGTDHGYVPVWLMQRGRIAAAIASDIGAEPLRHAKETAAEYKVSGIDFRLCAGLDAIDPEEVETILIAGMGGETIQTILSNAPWTADGGYLLLLQPMTKVELLRKWLSDNQYHFTEERLVCDKNHLYPVFAVRGGAGTPITLVQQYGGVMLDGDPLYAAYLEERIAKLYKVMAGLEKSLDPENAVKIKSLMDICRLLEEKRGTL